MPSNQQTHTLQVANLKDRADNAFDLRPDAETCGKIATDLDLLSLRKVSIKGVLQPSGQKGWRLTARLGATVQQSCVITLDPVTTRLEEAVVRHYDPHPDEPADTSEVEMIEDVTVEPLGREVNLLEIVIESIALALPTYPRSSKATQSDTRVTEPGKTPLSDDDVKPFASLSILKAALEKPN